MKHLQVVSLLILTLGIGFQGMAQSDEESNQQSLETLKEADDLYDIVPGDEIEGEVVSFQLSYKSAEDPSRLFIHSNHGVHFDKELQTIINNAQPNDKIWIDDIKTVKNRTSSYAFEVKE